MTRNAGDLKELKMPPAHKQQGNKDLSPVSARNRILTILEMNLDKDPESQMRTQPANTLTSHLLSMKAVETICTSDLQIYLLCSNRN